MSTTKTLPPQQTFAPQQSHSKITSLFRVLPEKRASRRWLDPQLSTGQFVLKIGKDSIWEATGPARESFAILAQEIKKYLEKSVEPISCWVSWPIYMMGKSIGTASPTIIFCCEVLNHRREIRKAVLNSGLLRAYPGFKTGHMPRPPGFDQLMDLAHDDTPGLPTGVANVALMNSLNSSNGACGMRLCIEGSALTLNGTPWTKTATIGGVIKVEERYFYTTAAHPFSPGIIEGPEVEDDSDAFSFDGSVDGDSEALEASSSDSAEEQDAVPQHKDPPVPLASHSLESLPPGSKLQPSLAAARKGALMTKEPLLSWAEHIYSGKNSLDYALIGVENASHTVSNHFFNTGILRKTICKRVVPFSSSECPVWALTARGAIRGSLDAAPCFVITPGSTTSCETRFAAFNRPLQEGDSGCWIVHELSGDVYGHIVAGSPQQGMAVVIPFSNIFEDIEASMRTLPTLPGLTHDIIGLAEDYKGKRLEAGPKEDMRNIPSLELLRSGERARPKKRIQSSRIPLPSRELPNSSIHSESWYNSTFVSPFYSKRRHTPTHEVDALKHKLRLTIREQDGWRWKALGGKQRLQRLEESSVKRIKALGIANKQLNDENIRHRKMAWAEARADSETRAPRDLSPHHVDFEFNSDLGACENVSNEMSNDSSHAPANWSKSPKIDANNLDDDLAAGQPPEPLPNNARSSSLINPKVPNTPLSMPPTFTLWDGDSVTLDPPFGSSCDLSGYDHVDFDFNSATYWSQSPKIEDYNLPDFAISHTRPHYQESGVEAEATLASCRIRDPRDDDDVFIPDD